MKSDLIAAGSGRPVVLFDLDGTLIDSAPGIAAALNATNMGKRRVSIDLVRSLVSFGAKQLIKESLEIADADIGTAIAKFREAYAADPCTGDDLYPGAMAALEQLQAREIGLAVCTNKPQQLAELVLQRVGLASLLEVVVGGAPNLAAKPDAAPVLRAVYAMGSVSQAVFIGDSNIDARAAHAAGLPFVFASFGYGYLDADVKCAGCLEHYSELLGLVRQIFDQSK